MAALAGKHPAFHRATEAVCLARSRERASSSRVVWKVGAFWWILLKKNLIAARLRVPELT